MTAVVGVLNKQAVAIAADSAVTIQNGTGTKIFNRANKIFTLSKYHPVGIMIYNEGSFLDTPWETIIKVYRKKLVKNSFDTVKEYQDDFLNFLKKNNFFIHGDLDRAYLSFSLVELLELIIENLLEKNDDYEGIESSLLSDKIFEDLKNQFQELILVLETNRKILPEFMDFEFEEFLNLFEGLLNEQISSKVSIFLPSYDHSLNSQIIKSFFYFITDYQSLEERFTGLVFTGFGENEYFPQLISLRVSFPINGRLRYLIKDDENTEIGTKHRASIRPFAQKDVIDTILRGIDPSFEQSIIKNFENTSQELVELLASTIEATDPTTATNLRSLDLNPIVQNLVKSTEEYQRSKHVSPLMDAVASLSKEDLAEMAESLIYLTYLKRRITFAQESVGGPVDVAIISKGDGFIWIKRKHYFDPKLNTNFFKNYFTS